MATRDPVDITDVENALTDFADRSHIPPGPGRDALVGDLAYGVGHALGMFP